MYSLYLLWWNTYVRLCARLADILAIQIIRMKEEAGISYLVCNMWSYMTAFIRNISYIIWVVNFTHEKHVWCGFRDISIFEFGEGNGQKKKAKQKKKDGGYRGDRRFNFWE